MIRLFGTGLRQSQTETMVSFENFIDTNQADTIIESFSTNSIAGSHDDGGGTDRINWRNLDVQNVTFDLQAGTADTIRGLPETMPNFENLIGSGISPGASIRSSFPVLPLVIHPAFQAQRI